MLLDTKWDGKLTWREVLLDAADYIDRIGWCQHARRDDEGRVCAAEALMSVVVHDVATYAEAITRLSIFVTAGEHSMAVLEWNDDEGRTASEVTGAMRACAWQ